jgi:hypothetical protein
VQANGSSAPQAGLSVEATVTWSENSGENKLNGNVQIVKQVNDTSVDARA